MLQVAIVAGGDSGEYGISMKSGRQVELFMDRSRFIPFLIEIRGKSWNYMADRKRFPVHKDDFTLLIGRKRIHFDMVFNAIHGTPGEDGKLQGYLDMLHIPYTSCNVTTSALTFNKHVCKGMVAGYGYQTAKSRHYKMNDRHIDQTILKELSLPVFVKPNNGGSSVGMSRVNHWDQLKAALEKAFQEDDEILVEEYVHGRELTCGVLRTKGKITALPVTEIIPKGEFFDYEAKYRKGMSDEVVPAMIPEKVHSKCREISSDLYKKLNCKGIVRFDFIFTGKHFYFLEVNTVPGLTKASIVPKMAAAHGWDFTEMISRIIEEDLK